MTTPVPQLIQTTQAPLLGLQHVATEAIFNQFMFLSAWTQKKIDYHVLINKWGKFYAWPLVHKIFMVTKRPPLQPWSLIWCVLSWKVHRPAFRSEKCCWWRGSGRLRQQGLKRGLKYLVTWLSQPCKETQMGRNLGQKNWPPNYFFSQSLRLHYVRPLTESQGLLNF